MSQENTMKLLEIAATLGSAVELYTGDTGCWTFTVEKYIDEDGKGRVLLSAIRELSDGENDTEFDVDDPWKKYGGDEIIKLARVRDYDDGLADSYTDKHGDSMYSDSAIWLSKE